MYELYKLNNGMRGSFVLECDKRTVRQKSSLVIAIQKTQTAVLFCWVPNT